MLPIALLKSLTNLPGYEQESFVRVHEQGEQVTSVRLNPFKKFDIQEHPFLKETTPVLWNQHGYYLQERPMFVLDPLWHAGAYYVQEASSMFIQYILEKLFPNPNEQIVLDLCAAPGGKSTLLASYFDKGLVVANETIKARNAILVENLTKWGSERVVVTQNDPAHFKALPHFFDLMVVDAPCSGSGLFRKDPSAISEWSEEAVLHCATRQSRIVEDSLDALKEGGYLIYSTCSYSFAENENKMDCIESIPGMKNITLDVPESWGVVTTESPVTASKGYRFYPDKIKGEGFFVAVFQKQVSENGGYYASDFNFNELTKKEKGTLAAQYAISEDQLLINHQNGIIAVPHDLIMPIKAVLKNLYVKKMGVAVGTLKGLDLIPAHALAMSWNSKLPYGKLALDLPTALQYLRRADLVLDGPKGWQGICYQNIMLGWAKLLPNRTNNYYPTEWRILKY